MAMILFEVAFVFDHDYNCEIPAKVFVGNIKPSLLQTGCLTYFWCVVFSWRPVTTAPPPPQTTLRAEPYDIQFSHVKSDSQSSEETTVSVVIGHKTLFLYDMDNADNPIELAFQPRYGEITTYKW